MVISDHANVAEVWARGGGFAAQNSSGHALRKSNVMLRLNFHQPLKIGGADGIRTHDLLDAIEARSQLRHSPTETTSVMLTSRRLVRLSTSV
jgi:hypothetical protein